MKEQKVTKKFADKKEEILTKNMMHIKMLKIWFCFISGAMFFDNILETFNTFFSTLVCFFSSLQNLLDKNNVLVLFHCCSKKKNTGCKYFLRS